MMSDTVLGPDYRNAAYRAPTRATGMADHVASTLSALDHATSRLMEVVERLDDRTVHLPSLVPGWSRAHVLSHLARNADGSVNLLLWARTGVEHPKYPSDADRDADIEEGAVRGHRLLLEDLAASTGRFSHAARTLPLSAWSAEVVGSSGNAVPAHEVLRARLLEVWVHLADLDHGFGFDDIPEPDVELLLEDVVQEFGGRHDVPPLSVVVDFDNHRRTWELRGTRSKPQQIRGRPGAMLGWLLGRTGPERLEGEAPPLPDWS